MIEGRRKQVEAALPVYFETCFIPKEQTETAQSQVASIVFRDHTAFLNSYAPEDEGLYNDAATR